MAIKYVDDAPDGSRKPTQDKLSHEKNRQAEGSARFATPIEATTPVNPDAGSQLPFNDLPKAEKAKRKRRT